MVSPEYLCQLERHRLAERHGAYSHQAASCASVANSSDERGLGEVVTRAERRLSVPRGQPPRRRPQCERQRLGGEQSTRWLQWPRSRPRGLVRQCQVRDAGLCLQRATIYSACRGVFFKGPRAVGIERDQVGCSLALTSSKNLEISGERGE